MIESPMEDARGLAERLAGITLGVPSGANPKELSPYPPPPPAPVEAQPPSTQPVEYAWAFAAPKSTTQGTRTIFFSATDEWYYNNPHSIQRVSMRFKTVLDPTLLCRGLYDAITEFPKVGSRVGGGEGGARHTFDLDAERVTLTVVHVTPELLASPGLWQRVCDKQRASGGGGAPPLFQALLLRSADWGLGSVLIACFDHVLGDGASYAMFMKRWSQGYERAHAQAGGGAYYARLAELPPDAFPESYVHAPASTKRAHRFLVRPERMEAAKAALRGGGWGAEGSPSANHVLMAEAAVALATIRREIGDTSKHARIAVLADHRGRGCPADWFGNGVVDLNVYVSWDTLEREDVLGAAAEIGRGVREQLRQLAHDLAGFEEGKAERSRQPKLFCWNSWGNATRTMIEGDFGETLIAVEWLNTYNVADSSVVLSFRAVEPPGALLIQVADFKDAEIERLSTFWGEATPRPIVPK